MLVTMMALLLLVTASGIVGMASLWVSQRRKQIGVRRAIGARQRDILRYFLVENLMVTTLGIVVGVGLALALNQLLVSQLEVARLPVQYLPLGMLALWALGLLAAFGPAWRASRIPPAVATRSA
jgi:putative ABC transport system permease protein